MPQRNGKAETRIKVWDPLVRIGHWVLVGAFVTAYVTGEDATTQHAWAGYVVAVIVLTRVAWGFFGSTHARFTDFLRGPRVTLRYLADLAGRRARRYIGHTPAGGAMILALLCSLAVTTWSGLKVYALEENAGPLAVLADSTGAGGSWPALIPVARADGDEHRNGREDSEDFWEELHEVAANVTLALVLLHIAGVVVTSRYHRENLVKAMVTGFKARGKAL